MAQAPGASCPYPGRSTRVAYVTGSCQGSDGGSRHVLPGALKRKLARAATGGRDVEPATAGLRSECEDLVRPNHGDAGGPGPGGEADGLLPRAVVARVGVGLVVLALDAEAVVVGVDDALPGAGALQLNLAARVAGRRGPLGLGGGRACRGGGKGDGGQGGERGAAGVTTAHRCLLLQREWSAGWRRRRREGRIPALPT